MTSALQPTATATPPSQGAWRPQLVALDIDGTLVDHLGVMPGHIIESVAAVLDAGVPVVLSTGRGWRSTQPIFEALNLPPGPAVCSNGAVRVQFPPFELTSVISFDPAPVILRAHELAPNAAIAVEDIGRGYRLNKPFPDGDLDGEMVFESIEELASRPANRVILRDPEVPLDQFHQLAAQLGMQDVNYAIGYTSWLDIAPAGVSKASALDEVCAELGIDPSDVLALGDGFNDVEMFDWAGRSVALGDAHEQVRTRATAVTGRFAEGGTSEELRRWFPVG